MMTYLIDPRDPLVLRQANRGLRPQKAPQVLLLAAQGVGLLLQRDDLPRAQNGIRIPTFE